MTGDPDIPPTIGCAPSYVVTAAHCVWAEAPPPIAARDRWEVTYQNLIASLGGERQVTAECVFYDPIADIAVLGAPDNQELGAEALAYEELTEQATPFPTGKLTFPRQELFRKASSEARMLSLDGEWFNCRVTSLGRSLWNCPRPREHFVLAAVTRA